MSDTLKVLADLENRIWEFIKQKEKHVEGYSKTIAQAQSQDNAELVEYYTRQQAVAQAQVRAYEISMSFVQDSRNSVIYEMENQIREYKVG